MTNDGLVQIQNGVLELGGGGTHTGDFVMSGPGVLSVTGGTHNFLADSSITGSSMTFAGGAASMGGSYDISGHDHRDSRQSWFRFGQPRQPGRHLEYLGVARWISVRCLRR
jgi:hypothetical protein